eukprot:TRINITY_DN3064_c0_g1_i1.p1 TRINITY_DN3064_c0_g1~~TRINITY_DN3064_c0_g1_i1.p1  ORF type:complete len:461 (+),score=82.56 TRINITY_DN3064_c0_g1_i1:88-1470(+)
MGMRGGQGDGSDAQGTGDGQQRFPPGLPALSIDTILDENTGEATPRSSRKINLMKTLGLSGCAAGKGADHKVEDDESSRPIVMLSPMAPDAKLLARQWSTTPRPEDALDHFNSAVSPCAAAGARSRSLFQQRSVPGSSGQRKQPIVSPHSPACLEHSPGQDPRSDSGSAPLESDDPLSEASMSPRVGPIIIDEEADRDYQRTPWGAMGANVHRESAAAKEKKNAAVDAVRGVVPVSRVRAMGMKEAPDGSNVKFVHFMRHGEGTSNSAARDKGHSEYKSRHWKDARLTRQGRDQALDVEAYVRNSDLKVDVLLVSPLRRAAVTGCIAFYSRIHDHPEVPIIAHEMLRERCHGNPCDQRVTRTELEMEVPVVDYSLIDEQDPMAGRVGEQGEKWEDTAERARKWLHWVSERPEKDIAVATHSAFLLVLFRLILDTTGDMREWFETGELRSVALVFPEDGGV